jgi:hypothetical protein
MNKNETSEYFETTSKPKETPQVEMHRSLYDSVNRLDLVIDALYSLKNRISPEATDQAKDGLNQKDEPSLRSVLLSSPSVIEDKREHMNLIIQDIEQLLF